jgi:hypothetical protein
MPFLTLPLSAGALKPAKLNAENVSRPAKPSGNGYSERRVICFLLSWEYPAPTVGIRTLHYQNPWHTARQVSDKP